MTGHPTPTSAPPGSQRPAAPPVLGLVLAGGLSSRMRRDKATLEYRGKSQLERAFELAARYLPEVFVSVRAGQAADPSRVRYPLIVDSVPGEGPIVGIRSALAARPEVAWLVLACDLPFLSDAALSSCSPSATPPRARLRFAARMTACPSRCARSGSPNLPRSSPPIRPPTGAARGSS